MHIKDPLGEIPEVGKQAQPQLQQDDDKKKTPVAKAEEVAQANREGAAKPKGENAAKKVEQSREGNRKVANR